MKKKIIVMLAMVFASIMFQGPIVTAQQKAHDNKEVCYLMKGGKMYHVQNGKETLMKKEVTLKDGIVIMTNGDYKMKNGKKEMLKEGECINENGKINHPKGKKL